MIIVDEIRKHGYITQVFNSFANEIAIENLHFHVLFTVTFFHKNIQINFTLILPLKKIK